LEQPQFPVDFLVFPYNNESMEGFTLSELAKALDIPQKTVEMRLFRAGPV